MSKLLVYLMVLIFTFTPAKVFAAGDIPEEVYIVAEDSLSSISDKLLSDPEKWGLASSDVQLTLGEGFKINFIDADKLSSNSSKKPEKLVATDIIEQWQFIINADDEPALFLTIAKEGDSYFLASYGGNASRYAQALEMAKAQNSNLDHQTSLYSFGVDYYFVSDKTVFPSYDVVDISSKTRSSLKSISTAQWVSGMKSIAQESKKDPDQSLRGSSQIVITKTTTPFTTYLPYIGLLILLTVASFVYTKKRKTGRQ